MAATRASGTNAVRYGTMRENVLSLTVVLADGRVIRTSRRARKSAAGYDLTRLFVGSEGTLGVITEVTREALRHPRGDLGRGLRLSDDRGGGRHRDPTIQSGVPVARIELLDEPQIDAINKYSKLDHKVAPTLFFEFHGTTGRRRRAGRDRSRRSPASMAATISAGRLDPGGAHEVVAGAARRLLRRAGAAAGQSKGWATDVCVPISRLAECIAETKPDLAQSSIPSALAGHVGDGNFHLIFMIDPNRSPKKSPRQAASMTEWLTRALAMEGTCTGEHGVGYGKMDFLLAEHGEAVEVMRTIKRAIDPDNLMNPGKIVRL